MKYIKPVQAIAFGLILNAICLADNYTVTLQFEQTEEALSTLFRAQVFPHPLGVHNGDDYDIYLWNPDIDIEPGVVKFNFTIFADVVIGGTPIQYNYPFSLPLNIPAGELSITGIIAFLEGIPAQINSMDGPQWVKDIIIAEYEGLELTVYPNSLLEDANANIPESWDLTVGNFGFTWAAETNLLKFTVFTEIESKPLTINSEYKRGDTWIGIRMNPNVPLTVLGYNIVLIGGTMWTNDRDLNLNLTPNTYEGNAFYIDFGTTVGSGGDWRLEVSLGSDYGLWIYTYTFTAEYNYWSTLSSYTVIP